MSMSEKTKNKNMNPDNTKIEAYPSLDIYCTLHNVHPTQKISKSKKSPPPHVFSAIPPFEVLHRSLILIEWITFLFYLCSPLFFFILLSFSLSLHFLFQSTPIPPSGCAPRLLFILPPSFKFLFFFPTFIFLLLLLLSSSFSFQT